MHTWLFFKKGNPDISFLCLWQRIFIKLFNRDVFEISWLIMYFCLSLTVSNLVTSKFKEFFFLWEKSLIITKTCARILSFFLILLSNKFTCFSSRQRDWSMLYAFSHVHSGIDLHLRVKQNKSRLIFLSLDQLCDVAWRYFYDVSNAEYKYCRTYTCL